MGSFVAPSVLLFTHIYILVFYINYNLIIPQRVWDVRSGLNCLSEWVQTSTLLCSTGGKRNKRKACVAAWILPQGCGSVLGGTQEGMPMQYPATVAGGVWLPLGSYASRRIISSPFSPSKSIFKSCCITSQASGTNLKSWLSILLLTCFTSRGLAFEIFIIGIWN